jgi:type 1 fimbria pilin
MGFFSFRETAAALLLLLSALAAAAPVSTDLSISLRGSVNTPVQRTCTFDAGSSDQAAFNYRRDAIPNYYFIWGRVNNFAAAKTGSYARYFKFVDYSVNCNFSPTANSILIGYRVVGGNTGTTTGGGNALANYIASTTHPSAGFYVCARTDPSCLSFRDILAGTPPARVAPDQFVLQPSGAYKASIDYAVAFVGLDLAVSDFVGELVAPDLVAAGGYLRDVTLDVTYN